MNSLGLSGEPPAAAGWPGGAGVDPGVYPDGAARRGPGREGGGSVTPPYGLSHS